jgi:hypothetical protein
MSKFSIEDNINIQIREMDSFYSANSTEDGVSVNPQTKSRWFLLKLLGPKDTSFITFVSSDEYRLC